MWQPVRPPVDEVPTAEVFHDRQAPLAPELETGIADLNQNWAKRDSERLPTLAVVENSYRYVRVEQGGQLDPIESLFDSRDDPREIHNWAEEDPETLERLRAVADAYEETRPSWGDAPTREISEFELNLLRALGYKIE